MVAVSTTEVPRQPKAKSDLGSVGANRHKTKRRDETRRDTKQEEVAQSNTGKCNANWEKSRIDRKMAGKPMHALVSKSVVAAVWSLGCSDRETRDACRWRDAVPAHEPWNCLAWPADWVRGSAQHPSNSSESLARVPQWLGRRPLRVANQGRDLVAGRATKPP